jgi:hypothetical protein
MDFIQAPEIHEIAATKKGGLTRSPLVCAGAVVVYAANCFIRWIVSGNFRTIIINVAA